jgi:hypothetical protein
MNKLIQNNKYSRKDVYNIFNPSRPIDSIWKQWGIINLGKYIAEMKDDFIFLLTKGSEVGGHSFDEGITEDGVLSWQSQPQNSFKSETIKKFIKHDEMLNNIYFFYRTAANEDYSFLGKLKYISHDSTREKPVYFQWQILDWNTVKNEEFALKEKTYKTEELEIKNTLLLDSAPIYDKERKGITTEEFRGRKGVDYSKQDKSNKKLGLLGEKLVLEYEIKNLEENNRHDLAQKVVHHSVTIGDGLGYDILSFDLNGTKKFIEVKTTKGISKTDFFVTQTELRRSEAETEFYLYRVYNFCEKTNSGGLYIKKGILSDNFDLIPNEYKARV